MRRIIATVGATLGIAAVIAAMSPIGAAVVAGITLNALD
jgi:hypothetical protein